MSRAETGTGARSRRPEGCWFWRPAPNPAGYGTFGFQGTSTSAHRVGYLIAKHEIPQGMVLDHLCRTRHCVNPDHLDPVPPRTNSRRSPLVFKSHCSKGHEFTPENSGHYGKTQARYCLTCHRERSRKSMQRLRDKVR